MGRKFGLSFSWKRAIGLSAAKGKISRAIGIPLTKSGRRQKIGRIVENFALGGLAALPENSTRRSTGRARRREEVVHEINFVQITQRAPLLSRLAGLVLYALGALVAFAAWGAYMMKPGEISSIVLGAIAVSLAVIGFVIRRDRKRLIQVES